MDPVTQGKARRLEDMPKRFVLLLNPLVLHGKLQYPALATHRLTGVEITGVET